MGIYVITRYEIRTTGITIRVSIDFYLKTKLVGRNKNKEIFIVDEEKSEGGKYSREDRNENAEKNQGGDSERQNEE